MTTDASQEIIGRQADEITGRLARGEQVWAGTSLAQRRELLGREAADGRQRLGMGPGRGSHQAAARGLAALGEEWISRPWAVRVTSAMARTLERLDRAHVLAGFSTRTKSSGRWRSRCCRTV